MPDDPKSTPVVYLIHFEKPLHHAQHYMGFTEDLKQRLTQHAMGKGARLMEVIAEHGIEWKLARTWENGSRTMERQLKNQHNAPLLCPECSGKEAFNRGNLTKQEFAAGAENAKAKTQETNRQQSQGYKLSMDA